MIFITLVALLKGFLTVGLFIAAAGFFVVSDVISGILICAIAVISLRAW
ncbi:MAG TPA: hypothetical protein PK344_17505 [Syntrophorhabdaceae bacterium]|jgi:hypothetical protein|nr:hypothetical protein [Syntrophorhabdaceae bacterium]